MSKLVKITLIILAIAIFSAYPAQAQDKVESSSCAVCHTDVKVKYADSVHIIQEIGCDICHGGNKAAFDRDAAHSAPEAVPAEPAWPINEGMEFIGKPDPTKIPALCARCHSNVSVMRPFGEFVDQYAFYRESRHGQLLEQGDTRVAVCTSCHGAHEILPAHDPRSRVSELNSPKMCAQCHSDKTLMANYNLPTDQFDQYEKSVHGQIRLLKGDTRAPSCPDCHGKHGAAPPGVSEVHNICGQCHFTQRDYFQQSAHQVILQTQELKECASCHGSHDIVRPKLDNFVDGAQYSCSNCHLPGSMAYLRGVRIRDAIEDAEQYIDRIQFELDEGKAKGLVLEIQAEKIRRARAKITEVFPLSHTLDIHQVEGTTDDARTIARGAEVEIHERLKDWNRRRLMLSINLVIFLGIIMILALKRMRLKPITET